MGAVVLEVKNVTKQFHLHKRNRNTLKETLAEFVHPDKKTTDDFYALRNISFSVREGEALGIIGKNGAGKSTLLRILSGILQPDDGEINFYGKVVSILEIGAGFHPELTGRENVFFSASLYGFTRRVVEKKFDAIVEFSAIGKFIDEPVKNYSSGMYLRLAFAIIAFLDADIYLIDEVISVGDADFQVKCKTKIEELINGGKTLVIASHNLNEIAMLSNRILYLENGEVTNEGGLEVIQQYLSRSLPQFQHMKNETCYQVKDIFGALPLAPEVVLLGSGISDFKETPAGISNKYSLKIFVELELLQEKHIDLAIRFFDQTNVILFVATTFPQNTQSIYAKGKYRVEFEIPANLLNSGLYAADLLLVNDIKKVFDTKDTQSRLASLLFIGDKFVSLKIVDEKEGDYNINFPGAIKPIIRTGVIYVESV